MGTLRSKRKLAEVAKESQKEYPTSNQARDTTDRRFDEGYITQVSEKK